MGKKMKKAVAPVVQNNLTAVDKHSKQDGSDENLVEEISENFDLFETWTIAHIRQIIGVCAVLLVLVAVVFTVIHFQKQGRLADTRRLANAENVEQLLKVLKDVSPAIPGYDSAQLRLGRLQAAEKKYEDAFKTFSAIADRKAEAYLSMRARLDSGYMQELAGKKAEAAVIYAMVADSADALADLRAEGAYAAGRMFYALKNMDNARKYLGQFDPAKSISPVAAQWASLAHAMLNRLPAAKAIIPAKQTAAPAVKAAVPAKKVSAGK